MKITVADLQNMSLEELRAMNTLIIDEIKYRGQKKMVTLEVGMTVKITHKRISSWRKFQIIEFKRTKLVVQEIDGTDKYVLTPNLVEVI
jgi:hypothetical protein